MEVDELVSGVQEGVGNVAFFRLHMIDVAIDVRYSRVVDLSDVSLRVGYGVDERDFSGPDGFDCSLYTLLDKPVSMDCQSFRGTIEFHVVIGLWPTYSSRHHQQVGSTDGFGEGNLSSEIIDGCLAADCTIARQVVVGGEHAADAGDSQVVIAENPESFVNLISEVRPVVIAVQLDEGNLGLLQAFRGIQEGFPTEPPVAPREVEASLEPFRVVLSELTELVVNLRVFAFEMLALHR
jgi:hypothetical protein